MSDNSKWEAEPKVVIKPAAYLKMLKHVLLYANRYRERPIEVMGICFGKMEEGVMVQHASVPISHGTALEVEFSEKDYAAFAHADEKMSEKGWYAIGWYHSHPGLTPFFSKLDIKNQLFYQKEQSPYAYGLVFDPQLMDLGDPKFQLGFQGFRLDDYTLGMATDYHEIITEVELPNTLSYYHEIDKIVNAIELKLPLIVEERELMKVESNFSPDISFNSIFQQANKDAIENEVKALIPSTLSGDDASLLKSLFTDIATRLSNHNQGIREPIAQLSEIISQMEGAVGPGVARLQKTFENDLVGIKKEWLNHSPEVENATVQSKEAWNEAIEKIVKSNTRIKDLLKKLGP